MSLMAFEPIRPHQYLIRQVFVDIGQLVRERGQNNFKLVEGVEAFLAAAKELNANVTIVTHARRQKVNMQLAVENLRRFFSPENIMSRDELSNHGLPNKPKCYPHLCVRPCSDRLEPENVVVIDKSKYASGAARQNFHAFTIQQTSVDGFVVDSGVQEITYENLATLFRAQDFNHRITFG